MKKIIAWLWGALLVGGIATASAESTCDFDIVGTWENTVNPSGPTATARYRFDASGRVTTLTLGGTPDNPEWIEPDSKESFMYRLDDPKAPTILEFIASDGVTRRGSLEIGAYDADSFTTFDESSNPVRWQRVDPETYFIVFAARNSNKHFGGPNFAMLIRASNGRAQTDAFGLYNVDDQRIAGRIPMELRSRFMSEPKTDTDALLRVRITASEYQRALKILQSWERRERERTMLYDIPHLNSLAFLREIAESLNTCSERVKLYKLDWSSDDQIAMRGNIPLMGFEYISELRRLNRPLHVPDDQFKQLLESDCGLACMRIAGK